MKQRVKQKWKFAILFNRPISEQSEVWQWNTNCYSFQRYYVSLKTYPLPYLGLIFYELEIFLLKLLGRNYRQISFKFSFKNNFYNKILFLILKTACLLILNKFKYLYLLVIYKFECESYKYNYIGSTMKQSKVRFRQHLGISPRTNRPTTLSHSPPWQYCEEKITPFNYQIFL